jgi:hypothetical protein
MVAARFNSWSSRPPAGLGLVGQALAWTVAGVVGLILAAAVTAALVVAGLIGAVVVSITGGVPRMKRPAKPGDADIIEAHYVGGHSWVAYGGDGRP